MKFDWKRKLTSRKLWLAVSLVVTLLVAYFTGDSSKAERIAEIVMAGGTVIAYIVGEGFADGMNKPSGGGAE